MHSYSFTTTTHNDQSTDVFKLKYFLCTNLKMCLERICAMCMSLLGGKLIVNKLSCIGFNYCCTRLQSVIGSSLIEGFYHSINEQNVIFVPLCSTMAKEHFSVVHGTIFYKFGIILKLNLYPLEYNWRSV